MVMGAGNEISPKWEVYADSQVINASLEFAFPNTARDPFKSDEGSEQKLDL
jgi:hypothetical protein